MQALHIRSPWERLGYFLPVFPSKLAYCLAKHLILLFSPVALHETMIVRRRLLVFSGPSLVLVRIDDLLLNQDFLAVILRNQLWLSLLLIRLVVRRGSIVVLTRSIVFHFFVRHAQELHFLALIQESR
jgi:hypothetical protein